jgi:predicted transcriptional regulator
MVAQPTPTVALLPIQPRYANAIIRGEKRVEFRRRRFGREVQYVVVYASSPIRAIIGYFRISSISEGCPRAIWEEFKHVGGIDHEDYFRYYEGADRAVAIGIERVCVLGSPVPLSRLSGSLKAPQSYSYLTREHIEQLTEISARPQLLTDSPGVSPVAR